MMKQLEKYLMPLAEKIGRNKYLMSIRDGFLVSTPLLTTNIWTFEKSPRNLPSAMYFLI